MIINELVSKEFVAAVRQMIDAHNQVVAAKSALYDAEDARRRAASQLTDRWFSNRSGEWAVPDFFCIEHLSAPYLINIDTEGEHAHEVKRIDGIYLEDYNG
jgi:hypothetical protein